MGMRHEDNIDNRKISYVLTCVFLGRSWSSTVGAAGGAGRVARLVWPPIAP